jgi:hypothetical protein
VEKIKMTDKRGDLLDYNRKTHSVEIDPAAEAALRTAVRAAWMSFVSFGNMLARLIPH